MTYAELLQAIKDFAVDAEATFYTHIPEFVRATEKRIYHDADLPVTSLSAAPTVTAGNPLLTMPTDFLSVDSLYITVSGSAVFLIPKEIDFLKTAYPTSTTGTPRYYAVATSTTLQLAPAPDIVYSTTLDYFGYPPSIVTANTTFLGDNFEAALLYGSLRDAAVYLKEEPDIVEMYNKQYADALRITGLFAGKSRTDTYRNKRKQA